MMKWMKHMAVKAMMKVQAWKQDEEGMEIIQVLILLALGVGLVALFMGFSDQITGKVSEKITDFLDIF